MVGEQEESDTCPGYGHDQQQQPLVKNCMVHVPTIDLAEYLSSKTSQEVAQIFDYIRMCCTGIKREVKELDKSQSKVEQCVISSPRTKYLSALGLKPVTLNPSKMGMRRASKRLRLAVKRTSTWSSEDARDDLRGSSVSVSRTVMEKTPSKKVHFPAEPVSDSVLIPRRPDGRHTRQNIRLSGYDQHMFISTSVGVRGELICSDKLEHGSAEEAIIASQFVAAPRETTDPEVARSTNCSPGESSDSGIEEPKDSREDEHENDDLVKDNDISVRMPSEYIEPGLKDMNDTVEVLEKREDDDAIVTVTDYGSFMVTRSSSIRSQNTPTDNEVVPFEVYKKKMQSKLKNNQNDSEIDLDSDSDESDDWQPSRTEEELEIIERKEDDNFKPSKVSLEGLVDKYKCENCDKVYQKSGHWIKHMKECSGVQVKVEYPKLDSYLQCTHCHSTFATPGSLQRHLVNMHALGQKSRMYEIPDIKIEIRMDSEEIEQKPKMELNACKLCGRKFVKGGHLLNHMKTVHKTLKTSENQSSNQSSSRLKNHCDLCQRTFFNFPSFRRHMKLHGTTSVKSERHSPKANIKKTYACKQCDKSFYTSPSLTRHVRTDHQGFKSKCTICGDTVARLDNHMSQIHAEKLAPCPVCRKLLAPSSISRHVRTVHMGCMVRCVECDKFVSNLHKHMWHEHATAARIRKEGHREHRDCDCVFFLGPAAQFVLKDRVETLENDNM